ncbi:TPA: hypothetical protein ACFRGQ_000345 [Neisseria lactamica]|uniref:hypothetical protein n=1 Tax=Neisseria lactamica TaxID=486 RepID=UPI001864E09B|nr:hypothetical protein [Neisseria lactamica]
MSFERFYPRTQTDFNRCTNFAPTPSRNNDFIRKHAASGTISNRPTEGGILSTRPAAHAAEEPPYQAS